MKAFSPQSFVSKSLRLFLALGLLALLAGYTVQPAGAQPDAATFTFSPAPVTVTGCSTTTVDVWVNDVVDVYGAEFQFSFDPAKLQIVDALPAAGVQMQPLTTFMNPGFIIRNTVDNTAGTAWYVFTQLAPETAKTGSGPIARITLRGKAAGSAGLDFTFTMLANTDGDEVLSTGVDGTANVVGPNAPVPTLSADSQHLYIDLGAVSGVAQYATYRATSPVFTPSDPPWALDSSLVYTDTNVIGDPTLAQHFYVFRSQCASGLPSADSVVYGEFDFAIKRSAILAPSPRADWGGSGGLLAAVLNKP